MSENGTTSTIRRSSSRAGSRRRKPKKNQIPIGILVLIFIAVIGVLLGLKTNNTLLFWMTGILFGFILQKARFCFTASMRDPYLTGSTSITRAVLIAFAVTTIGFTAIKYGYFKNGLPIPGMGYVVPISFATVIGAFLFGIGMVIAGGCASGTLMRVGEGFWMQLLSLVFFVVGSLWGAHDFGWWKLNVISKGKAIFLPDVFGWLGAVIIQLLIILFLYIAAVKYEKAKANS
ncbi:YeeE/YedE thiosulfate transporter family protein [Vallitalea guaymasensis]|mgnify:CR=1 FL=1|uniref:YeeE/YedE family protein n=1 Tax=Vallitalea guaymasensis TaxID=1185412 RepID=A0A8J8MBP8_9FIRM|nr:YeeE/YedE thiosulfate transporter family protein [Vallitalea guaymasensis]QUH30016.1 YeeE/YedE family protein [Vallitalea guaymasensis]